MFLRTLTTIASLVLMAFRVTVLAGFATTAISVTLAMQTPVLGVVRVRSLSVVMDVRKIPTVLSVGRA